MAEKKFKSRIVHKHDTAANWNKATNFIPKQGEVIVYDKDSTYLYERFKIGDGVTNINSLPFADEQKLDKATFQELVGDTAVSTQIEEALENYQPGNDLDTTSFLRVSDVGSAVDPNPINADMLGGKSAGDFALKTDLNKLASKTDLTSLATKTEIAEKAPSASPIFTGIPKVSPNANYTVAQIRNIIISTVNPTASDGNNGDIWIKYIEG